MSLDHDTLLKLHDASVSIGLESQRHALQAGIDRAFLATLPVETTASAQLLSDLAALNEAARLLNGTVPLEIWLKNAETLARGRVETSTFRAALEMLRSNDRRSISDDPGMAGAPTARYFDKTVRAIHEQLHTHIQMAPANQEYAVAFHILYGLFYDRNTFNEPVEHCVNEHWAGRLLATIETNDLLLWYRSILVTVRGGPARGLDAYDELRLSGYLVALCGLFRDPKKIRLGAISNELRLGRGQRTLARLQRLELHPKTELASNIVRECDERQRAIKNVWSAWRGSTQLAIASDGRLRGD